MFFIHTAAIIILKLREKERKRKEKGTAKAATLCCVGESFVFLERQHSSERESEGSGGK